MKVRVEVFLKPGVLDVQGKAIEAALGGLGFAGVSDVRVGRIITLDIAGDDKARAEADRRRARKARVPADGSMGTESPNFGEGGGRGEWRRLLLKVPFYLGSYTRLRPHPTCLIRIPRLLIAANIVSTLKYINKISPKHAASLAIK